MRPEEVVESDIISVAIAAARHYGIAVRPEQCQVKRYVAKESANSAYGWSSLVEKNPWRWDVHMTGYRQGSEEPVPCLAMVDYLFGALRENGFRFLWS